MPLKPAVSALARKTIKTAYDELDRTITPGDKRDFGKTTLQHVRQAALDIETQLAARQSLRNMRRLMPFFQGLEHYSKVVDILCNGTPYLPWIWAPITLILRIACEYVGAFEQIIKGYASIAESLRRFEILRDAFIGNQEFQQTLAVFYADILEFHKNAYKFVRRSGWKLMFVTSWGRFERKFNNILEDLNRHGSLIDTEANARNIANSNKMREEIRGWREESQSQLSREKAEQNAKQIEAIAEAKRMREDIRAWREESQSQLSRDETEQSAKQFEAIASWLKINESDQLAIFDSISSEVAEHQGTCGWILKNKKVSSWFEKKPDTPALWLQGSAGTGKSVLCTQLVNFMKASNMFVVHHFCTYRYVSSTAYEQILKSLILQLVRQDGDLTAHVYEAYVLEKKSPTATALEQLFHTLLANMSNQPSQEEYAWVIIDGLDECELDRQTRLIRLINQVTSKPSLPGSTVCKFLISSRSPSNALQKLCRKQTVSLTDEKDSLHGAIGQYVRERLRSLDTRLRQLGIGQPEVEEIRNVIVTKADGMFLYARLVMDYLASNIFYSGDEIKQSVNQLPKKLAEFYHKILTQILIQLDPRSVDRVRCILGWVAFAKRPLQKLEFLSAITFSPGDPKVDILAPQYILDICGTLVEERRDSTLAFIHISVKEFLQSSSSNIAIHKQQALHEHGVATITCLLSGLRVFGSRFPEQEKFLRVGKGLHGFHVYATEYWTEYLLSHVSRAEGLDTDSPALLMSLACQLAETAGSSNTESVAEHDSGTNHLDERISNLWQYPTLSNCVRRALKARSLKNLEARVVIGHASQKTSEPSKHRLMSESISNLLESYQEVVKSLFHQDHYPGLSGEEMELFRAQLGTAALTCRLGSCPRATLGFEVERLRSEHEMSHVRYFPCVFPGCQYPPFASAQALRNHTSKYHTPTAARTAIRKDGTERHRHIQEQSTVVTSTSAPGYSPHRQVAQRTQMSGSNPQPQMLTIPSLWEIASKVDVDIQQQSTVTAPPFPENKRAIKFDVMTAPESLFQLQINHSLNPYGQYMEPKDIHGNANGTQPDDRSLPTKTSQHPAEIILKGQNDSLPRLSDGNFAEPAHFRSMDTLNEEELDERGSAFRLYALGAPLDHMTTLIAAAAFGQYEDAKRLIYENKVHPDPLLCSVSAFDTEFSTPILAAIGGSGSHLNVIRLLLSNPNFNPTKGFGKNSYAAIAIQRRGRCWREESIMLWSSSMDHYAAMEGVQVTSLHLTATPEEYPMLIEGMQQASFDDEEYYTISPRFRFSRCQSDECSTSQRIFPHPESCHAHMWYKHGVKSWEESTG